MLSNIAPFWWAVLQAVIGVGLGIYLGLAVWRLVDVVRSSEGRTNRDPHHWLRHPFSFRPTRTVLIRLLLVIVIPVTLYSGLSVTYTDRDLNDNTAAETPKTKPVTVEQAKEEAVKAEKEQRKRNFEHVDSPGIHYKPKKVDPDEHTRKILERMEKK